MKPFTTHYKDLARLGVPIVIGQLGIIFVSFIDTFMVGLLGNAEMAAVTAANVPIFIIQVVIFGFQSGRNVDKFADCTPLRSDNGLAFLPRYINSFLSLKVEQYVDLDTHGLFICSVTEARVLSDRESMTYAYYHEHVKPKPDGKKGWVCKICGYVYEGDPLPDDFICPLCKHGASDFEEIK